MVLTFPNYQRLKKMSKNAEKCIFPDKNAEKRIFPAEKRSFPAENADEKHACTPPLEDENNALVTIDYWKTSSFSQNSEFGLCSGH